MKHTPQLTVIAPAFYPTLWHVRYLLASSRLIGLPVQLYGFGSQYTGWYQAQIAELLPVIAALPTSHVLYTDASDAFVLADIDEIWRKYREAGKPDLLISLEHDGGECAGGWMGSVAAAEDAVGKLARMQVATTNPQERWREALATGLVDAARDTDRQIFQVVDEPLVSISANRRLYNPATRTYPCVVHFAGGYSAPEGVGKAELIDPIWHALGLPPIAPMGEFK